ncbi:inositol monophosphatase [Candidatus Woesebacteria bacterium]|nr:inositol monophosphatase [Candidatus Woesebacteria bacterium]
MIEPNKIRELAEQLAVSAGEYLVKVQGSAKVAKQKDRQDICTNADLGSEDIIIRGIHEKYPSHNIYSEEAGNQNLDSEYYWIIDPLDGTKEYVRGIPQFNVSIAVEYKGDLIVGVVYRPSDNSLYSASIGEGAFLNEKKIYVSTIAKLEDSFVYCYLPSSFRNPERYIEAWNRLGKIGKRVYRLRSFADENTILCWLAQGGHEAYINLSNPPKWHDLAPGLFIAKEAGAYITHKMIDEIKNRTRNSIIIANNDTIWRELNNN